jgi:hypothetical protein
MADIKAPTNTGKRVNELIIKNRMSAEDATRSVLGNLADKYTLPQGATIVSAGTNDLIYKDAQGYTHRIQREGDANSPNFGQVRELQTDRPAVLPLTEQIPGLSPALQAAINAVQSRFSGGGLLPLAQSDEQALEAISSNERSLINQEATRAQGELVTQLYGQGINKSTIANQSAADFSQALAIALGNQASNAATRKLDLQKFLDQLITGGSLDLIGNITGQETTRAGTSAQVGLGEKQLTQQGEEAARNFMLEWEKFQAAQNKSKLPGILSAVASIATAIPGVGPLIGGGIKGLSGILGGRSMGRDESVTTGG